MTSRSQFHDETLIAEYALGVLDSDDLVRAHALLNESEDAVALALEWEQCLLDLVDILPPAHAPAELWFQIQAGVGRPSSTSLLEEPSPAPETALDFPESSQRFLVRPDPGSVASDQLIALSSAPKRPLPADRGSPDSSPTTEGSFIASTPDELPQKELQSVESEQAAPTDFGASGSTLNPQATEPAGPTSFTASRVLESLGSGAAGWIGRYTWRSLWFWRVACTLLAVFAIVIALGTSPGKNPAAFAAPLLSTIEPAPVVTQVAIMQAPGNSSTPGWILRVDSTQRVTLTPMVEVDLPETSALYLWTYNDIERQPRFLGWVDSTQSLTLPADVVGPVRPGQIFEMTQEPNEHPPSHPDGPILFIGRTVDLSS